MIFEELKATKSCYNNCKKRTSVSELEGVLYAFSKCERTIHIHFPDPVSFVRFVHNAWNRIVIVPC